LKTALYTQIAYTEDGFDDLALKKF